MHPALLLIPGNCDSARLSLVCWCCSADFDIFRCRFGCSDQSARLNRAVFVLTRHTERSSGCLESVQSDFAPVVSGSQKLVHDQVLQVRPLEVEALSSKAQ